MDAVKIHKVAGLYEEAVRAELYGVEALHEYGAAELARIYNGIGPDALPPGIRQRVTDYLALFEPAALIHDVRYASGDGTETDWHAANEEFLANCLALVKRKYGWKQFVKYGRAKFAAYAMFDLVESHLGWRAYNNGRNQA